MSSVADFGSFFVSDGLGHLVRYRLPVSRQLFFAVPWNRKKVAGGTPWYGERLGKTWNFKIIDRSYHLLHRIFTLLSYNNMTKEILYNDSKDKVVERSRPTDLLSGII